MRRILGRHSVAGADLFVPTCHRRLGLLRRHARLQWLRRRLDFVRGGNRLSLDRPVNLRLRGQRFLDPRFLDQSFLDQRLFGDRLFERAAQLIVREERIELDRFRGRSRLRETDRLEGLGRVQFLRHAFVAHEIGGRLGGMLKRLGQCSRRRLAWLKKLVRRFSTDPFTQIVQGSLRLVATRKLGGGRILGTDEGLRENLGGRTRILPAPSLALFPCWSRGGRLRRHLDGSAWRFFELGRGTFLCAECGRFGDRLSRLGRRLCVNPGGRLCLLVRRSSRRRRPLDERCRGGQSQVDARFENLDPGPKRRDFAARLPQGKQCLAIALGEVAEFGQQLTKG